MTDNSLRHTIALFTTLITLFAWVSGYFSGVYGWWWTVIGVVVIYFSVYQAVNKD